MKKILLPIITLLLTSCAITTEYYQVYKTNIDNGIVDKNEIVFEDNNCKVFYDLWNEGGDVGFSIYNKTESDLTIYLNKTFFVLNGVAYEYFQNRTFSKSSNSGTSVTSYNYPNYWNNNLANVTGSSSTGFSITYKEKPDLTIPSKTLIHISEYNVTNERYASCDLSRYPSRKNIKTLKYSNGNSPFVFYNRITYATKSDTLRLENKFYVSEITNYPADEMFDYIDTTACGKRLDFATTVFKDVTPDKFYIKYLRRR
jgi:hypothetical protein